MLGRTSEAQTTIPDCESDTACLALYERASQESKQGNLAEAVRLYKLAYEARADPKLLFSIARLLHRLDRKQEAIVYYKQFIDSPLDYAEQKRKAEQYLEQARQGTGAARSVLPATNQQPIPSQSEVAPPSPATPSSQPLPENPHPRVSQAEFAPTGSREHSPAKRPRWRLIVGGAVIGAGLVLTGFGGSALAAQGKCVDIPTAPAQICDEVFATKPVGGALLGTGAVVVIGGIVLMAWPGK